MGDFLCIAESNLAQGKINVSRTVFMLGVGSCLNVRSHSESQAGQPIMVLDEVQIGTVSMDVLATPHIIILWSHAVLV